MSKFVDLLRRETRELADQLGAGPPTDRTAILEALDRITALHQAVTEAQRFVADTAPGLVRQALLAGVPQPDLVNRPYHETQVRRLARDAGVPAMPKGRRPSRRSPGS